MGLRCGAALFELCLATTIGGCGSSFAAGGDNSSDGGANTSDVSMSASADSGLGSESGSSGETGSITPVDDSGFVSADGFAFDGAPDPTCHPNEQPGDGVFVSASSATSGDGSAALPLKTIAEGLALAAAAQKATIYLDQGTYAEQAKLVAQHSGVTLQGGFRRVGAAWERDCSNNATLKTVIGSPTNVGLSATSLTKRTVVRLLSVFTKAMGDSTNDQGGQSCYGIIASGDGTALALDNVIVKVGAGGAGGLTTTAVTGPAASCGNGLNTCADGANGQPGTAAAVAVAGMFSVDGYAVGNGAAGLPGQPGHNGTVGLPGESATCYGEGCSGGGGPCSGHFCGNLVGTSTQSALPGSCGCGGRGGSAGGAGHGGGASVGIYAAGKATVVLTAVQIQTSAGGNGSVGGAGSAGAPGVAGQKGANATCPGVCASVDVGGGMCNCGQPGTRNLNGGAAGGTGGAGGKGSDGTGGSGGPSYGIVRQGGAIVTHDATSTIKVAAGGKGAGAPDGAAAEENTAP